MGEREDTSSDLLRTVNPLYKTTENKVLRKNIVCMCVHVKARGQPAGCFSGAPTQWTTGACGADWAAGSASWDLPVPTSSAWQPHPDPGALGPGSGEGVCLSPGYL